MDINIARSLKLFKQNIANGAIVARRTAQRPMASAAAAVKFFPLKFLVGNRGILLKLIATGSGGEEGASIR
jgi:hypothetical protein